MGEDVDYFNNSTYVASLINDQSLPPSNDDTQLTLTLMIISWHVVVTSFIVNNSHTQDYTYPDDQHFNNDTTPLFKPFTTRQEDWVWLWLVYTNGIPQSSCLPVSKRRANSELSCSRDEKRNREACHHSNLFAQQLVVLHFKCRAFTIFFS